MFIYFSTLRFVPLYSEKQNITLVEVKRRTRFLQDDLSQLYSNFEDGYQRKIGDTIASRSEATHFPNAEKSFVNANTFNFSGSFRPQDEDWQAAISGRFPSYVTTKGPIEENPLADSDFAISGLNRRNGQLHCAFAPSFQVHLYLSMIHQYLTRYTFEYINQL